MNRHNLYVVLAITGLVVLFGLLPVLGPPELAWAILGATVVAMVAVIANLLYALLSIEMGYYTAREKPKRRSLFSGRAFEHFRMLLHNRALRHH